MFNLLHKHIHLLQLLHHIHMHNLMHMQLHYIHPQYRLLLL